MYIKKTIILKAIDISAVQIIKFIGSFYWLYKALKHSLYYEYKSTVHVIVRCIFLLFYYEAYYFICMNTVMP